ncbi:MAG: DUF7305 domain-containing protein [Bacillota bacterium]
MNIKNEKGAALITVLLVFTGLSILVTPFMSLIVTEIRQSGKNNNSIQSYHYARSGVEHVLANRNFEDNKYYLDDNFNEINLDAKSGDWIEDNNWVEVGVENFGEILYIESTGKYRNEEKDTNLMIEIKNLPPVFEHAIFASDELNQKGTDKEIESVGALNTTDVSIKDEDIEIEYYEPYPDDYTLPSVDTEQFQKKSDIDGRTVVSFGGDGSGEDDQDNSEDQEMDEGDIYIPEQGNDNNNQETKYIVEGEEAFLRVDKIDLQKDELITQNPEDDGEEKVLHLLVEESFDINSQQASIISEDNTHIVIYFSDDIETMKYSGVGDLDSFIYAPNTEVSLRGKGGKDFTFHGGIMAQKVDLAGNSDVKYKDLFQKMDHLELAIEEDFTNFISMDLEWGAEIDLAELEE